MYSHNSKVIYSHIPVLSLYVVNACPSCPFSSLVYQSQSRLGNDLALPVEHTWLLLEGETWSDESRPCPFHLYLVLNEEHGWLLLEAGRLWVDQKFYCDHEEAEGVHHLFQDGDPEFHFQTILHYHFAGEVENVPYHCEMVAENVPYHCVVVGETNHG